MKIQYLGTAAAEGIPAIFCHCSVCEMARKKGGKNLRARTQAVVDDKILIDYSPDTYMNSIRFNLDLSKIKHLIITHTHLDHFAPFDLELRSPAFATNMAEQTLTVYGTKTVGEKLKAYVDNPRVNFVELVPLVSTKIEEYIITPLPARHMLDREEIAVFYLIEKGENSMLYCTDTGLDEFERHLPKQALDFLVKRGKQLDFIGFDCTFATKLEYDYRQHLSFLDNAVIFEKLKQDGLATDKTIVYSTHFSHWDMVEHKKMEKYAKKHGIKVAYDGVVVEF